VEKPKQDKVIRLVPVVWPASSLFRECAVISKKLLAIPNYVGVMIDDIYGQPQPPQIYY